MTLPATAPAQIQILLVSEQAAPNLLAALDPAMKPREALALGQPKTVARSGRDLHAPASRRWGLGLFAAGGTQIGLDAQMPPIIAVILGVVTAVFGGVLRDIVCNEIPRAFSDHRPYAICAFAGGWTLVALHTGGLPASLSLLAAAAVTTLLRAGALVWNWRLPRWQA